MECSNKHCHLKSEFGDELSPFKYESMEFTPCEKCKTTFYCSQRCAQQDWFKRHQFECRGWTKDLQLSDVERIESSTPFIKEGWFTDKIIEDQDNFDGIDLRQPMTLNDIEFVKKGSKSILGKGSYGEVELAVHKKTGVQLAIKKIDKTSLANKKIRATLMREVDIHKKLKHDNIVRLFTSFEDKNFIYLVLEYASKGNLFYFIRNKKKLSEDEAFYFFIQCCAGIYFLHKNGLIHRDIKPENLLINKDNILKICDFGWCVQANEEEQRNTFCGTLEYMAPEMLQNFSHNHTLDVWCIGILLFELVHGKAPFTGANPRDIGQKIMKRQIQFDPKCTAEYKDLVDKLLQHEPANRIPLIKVFEHPWVKIFEDKYNLRKSEESPEPVKEELKESELNNSILNQSMQSNRSQKNLFSKKNDESKGSVIKTTVQSSSVFNKQDSSSKDRDFQDKPISQAKPQQMLNQPMKPENPNPVLYQDSMAIDLSDDEEEDDVMKELEDFVKPKKQVSKKKKNESDDEDEDEDDVYGMCDKMLDDLAFLDAKLQKRESRKTGDPKQSIQSKNLVQQLQVRQSQKQSVVQEKQSVHLDWINKQHDEIVGSNQQNDDKNNSDDDSDSSDDSNNKTKMSIVQQQQQQQQIKKQSYINSSSGQNSYEDRKREEYDDDKPGNYKRFNDQVNDDNYYPVEVEKNSYAVEKPLSAARKHSDDKMQILDQSRVSERISQQKREIEKIEKARMKGGPQNIQRESERESYGKPLYLNEDYQSQSNQQYQFEEGPELNSCEVSQISGFQQKQQPAQQDRQRVLNFLDQKPAAKPKQKDSVYDKYPLKNSYQKEKEEEEDIAKQRNKLNQLADDLYKEAKFSVASNGSGIMSQKQVFSAKPFTQSKIQNEDRDGSVAAEKLARKQYEEAPKVELRQSESIIDYEKIREEQMKNMLKFMDNLEIGDAVIDEKVIQNEVKEYTKAQKNYKKQYKENVKNVIENKKQQDREDERQQRSNGKDKKPQQQQQDKSSGQKKKNNNEKAQQDDYEDLWNCQRVPDKNNLKYIPLDERGQQQWLNSRKADMHLELDFLPRSLVYNYGDFAESNDLMNQVLEDLKVFGPIDESVIQNKVIRDSEFQQDSQLKKKESSSSMKNQQPQPVKGKYFEQYKPSAQQQQLQKQFQQQQKSPEKEAEERQSEQSIRNSEMRMSKNIFNKIRNSNDQSIRMSSYSQRDSQQVQRQSEKEEYTNDNPHLKKIREYEKKYQQEEQEDEDDGVEYESYKNVQKLHKKQQQNNAYSNSDDEYNNRNKESEEEEDDDDEDLDDVQMYEKELAQADKRKQNKQIQQAQAKKLKEQLIFERRQKQDDNIGNKNNLFQHIASIFSLGCASSDNREK